jgi:hypothetical protein
MTTDEAAKAELALKIADERLAEATVMAEEGDTESAAQAQEEHDAALATAEEATEAIESDGDADLSIVAMEKVAKLKQQIEGHAAKVASVKDAILARVAAKKTPEQLAHMQEVFDRIKAKAAEMEAKTKAKEEKVKTKYKALAKKTDAEVEAKLAEIEQKVKEKIAEKVQKAETKAKNKAEDKIEEKVKEKVESKPEAPDLQTQEDGSTEESTSVSGGSEVIPTVEQKGDNKK